MNVHDNRRVLSFMAHPDDAEFYCAGTLIRLAELGWEVHIMSAAPGDCGTVSHTPWEIGGIRTKEAAKAAALIGATYHCLGENDGYIVYDKPSIRKSIDMFRMIAPALMITHPRGDYMMDHEMTSLLARAATFLYSAPNATPVPMREGSQVPHLYYCDPPEGIDYLGNRIEPTTYIDISGQVEKKAEMLACHASQREWLKEHHGMDEYVDSMRRQAAMRGEEIGASSAEAFVQHRGHSYPRNDILRELLG